MSNDSNPIPTIKLRGPENYNQWRSQILNYLEYAQATKAIKQPPKPREDTSGLSEVGKAMLLEIKAEALDQDIKQAIKRLDSTGTRMVLGTIKAKRSWLLIEDEEDDPYEHHQKNAFARQGIIATLSPSMHKIAHGYRSAYIIWHILAEHCRQTSESEKTATIRKFYQARPSLYNDSLEKYATGVDELFRQLEEYGCPVHEAISVVFHIWISVQSIMDMESGVLCILE